ncbi:MAG: hypothetical protein H6Q17_528 [Bacteroidetes bacterium]|nr:hypothetical protein [Bacteroidota bacterium]
MKTSVSKSAVMSRAWRIFKSNNFLFPTFSLALQRAWKVEKQIIADKEKKTKWQAEMMLNEAAENVPPIDNQSEAYYRSEAYIRGAMEYYRTAHYTGD